MKKCSKCGELKPLTEFYKSKINKDGLRGQCKKCHNKQSKKWQKKYRKNNPEKVKEGVIKWRENNPEKIKEYSKKYYKDNHEKIKEKSKIWRKNNPEYRKDNIENIKKIEKKSRKKRMKNPSYRINRAISNGIWKALKGNKNGRHWETLVGYTLEDLKQHLEAQFEPWMNWENHGVYEEGKLKWQIDHIRPVSSFDFETTEDEKVKECWALSNLQPLEAIKNIKKSNILGGDVDR